MMASHRMADFLRDEPLRLHVMTGIWPHKRMGGGQEREAGVVGGEEGRGRGMGRRTLLKQGDKTVGEQLVMELMVGVGPGSRQAAAVEKLSCGGGRRRQLFVFEEVRAVGVG